LPKNVAPLSSFHLWTDSLQRPLPVDPHSEPW